MLKEFKYRQLVFIHSSDTDGRALLGRFQTKTQDLQSEDQEVKVQVDTLCPDFIPLDVHRVVVVDVSLSGLVIFLIPNTLHVDSFYRHEKQWCQIQLPL